MISVLIPTYNYNFSELVCEIHQQLLLEKIPFEIICVDDASPSGKVSEKVILNLENVTFSRLKNNIGRSRIRNLLAEMAKYDWFLFLDSDTKPVSGFFIKNYISEILNSNLPMVYCGGIFYKEEVPEKNRFLRWNFGRNREQMNLMTRTKKPYETFFSSNFLIHKEIFYINKFNSAITMYGYEDVVFASDLKRNNYIIKHIENPVFHLGLETNEEFLEKTKIAIDNLLELKKKKFINKNEVRLLFTYHNIRKLYFDTVLVLFYRFFGKYLDSYLKRGKSKLFMFDFFKITYLSYLSKH